MRPYINPVMTNPEEVTSQRFYLRKIEGAEILLGFETNFFRQELHKWAPVAPNPPPVLEQSLSTRKPRPTKQQKLMQQHNVNSPEELPLQFRTKPYNINKARKGSDVQSKNQSSLAPAQRPRSSHSTSTNNSSNPYSDSHRPPPPPHIHIDPSYSAHYPLPASHNPHQQPDSPAFAQSPYYSNGHHPQSPFVESPRYGPRSPLGHPGSSLDPNLFDSPYDTSHPHDRVMGSPHHGYTNSNVHTRETVDNMFDQFVTQPEDDMNHQNELAEALEERGRENDELEDVRDVLNDYVHDSYQK
jgi:histone demethylase JARID1